jgi:hypothetical protein
MKMNIGDLVANSMNQVLNSKEHASLFKKAYAEECMDCGMAKDGGCTCAPKCKQCKKDKDNCMCGDMMADDQNNLFTKHNKCKSCNEDKDNCMCGEMYADENNVSNHEDSDMSWAEDSSMKSHAAIESAMQDLLTASAALDYAGLSKASELTLKIATLVSEAKKGKVNLKKEVSGSKSTSSTSKSTSSSSTSKSTSSASKAKKKMTMKEKMKMLREKAEKAKKAKKKK